MRACAGGRVDVSKKGGGGREGDEREEEIASLIASAFCELKNIKQPVTTSMKKIPATLS